MNCPSPRCGSSNVQLLSHYVDSLPPGSPLRSTYARPAMPEGGFLGALAAVVIGVALLVSGGVLAGVVALAAGLGWGYVLWGRHSAADAARAAWANRRICLACTEQWVP
jgi:hypothetical protein